MDTQQPASQVSETQKARSMLVVQMKLNGVRPAQWKEEWDEPFMNKTFKEWPQDLQEFTRPHGGPMVV